MEQDSIKLEHGLQLARVAVVMQLSDGSNHIYEFTGEPVVTIENGSGYARATINAERFGQGYEAETRQPDHKAVEPEHFNTQIESRKRH